MARDRASQVTAPVARRMQLPTAMITTAWIVLAAVAIVLIYVFAGIRVVRPTQHWGI